MDALALVAACAVGGACAALVAIVMPPTRRLAMRVRPYTVVPRTALGLAPDLTPVKPSGGAVGGLFGPPLRAAIGRMARGVEHRGDEHLARTLRQAGLADVSPDEYRVRQLVEGALGAAAAGAAVLVLIGAPTIALVAAVAGGTVGATRCRRRVERAVTERAGRIRLELYTINHLLAMHVRTGAGPIQAVQRIVDRGQGIVVEELAAVLTWTRRGIGEAEAFRRAAELTPEPSAARTYQLLAAGVERGADLGSALLALSEDMRDSRREEMHKQAVRRRAAMLIPTIAILAPIMLLFIAAPLPSVVLGNR